MFVTNGQGGDQIQVQLIQKKSIMCHPMYTHRKRYVKSGSKVSMHLHQVDYFQVIHFILKYI